jgi:hypothetical protein
MREPERANRFNANTLSNEANRAPKETTGEDSG